MSVKPDALPRSQSRSRRDGHAPKGTRTAADRLRAIGRALGRPRVEPSAIFSYPMAAISVAALLLSGASFLLGLDESVARAMRNEPDGVRAFLDVVTDIGLIAWYFYPALFLSLALFFVDPKGAEPFARHGHRRLFVVSAWFAASLASASAITHTVKYLLGRARPELLDSHGIASFEVWRLGSAFESFPSGHSTNMGVVAMALAVWFPALRWPMLLAGAALALTRIVVEAHWLSDVVAGFAIGALTALTLARLMALKRVVYRVDEGGRGWRGLLPYRPAG